MRLVYIAGPFRAENAWKVEQNIRSAEALALEVLRAGFAAICPHSNTRFFDGALPDAVFLEAGLEILRRCDAVLLVKGWEDSKGTHAEIAEAYDRGIPVFTSLDDLIQAKK